MKPPKIIQTFTTIEGRTIEVIVVERRHYSTNYCCTWTAWKDAKDQDWKWNVVNEPHHTKSPSRAAILWDLRYSNLNITPTQRDITWLQSKFKQKLILILKKEDRITYLDHLREKPAAALPAKAPSFFDAIQTIAA
jgi:hypothetical protein